MLTSKPRRWRGTAEPLGVEQLPGGLRSRQAARGGGRTRCRGFARLDPTSKAEPPALGTSRRFVERPPVTGSRKLPPAHPADAAAAAASLTGPLWAGRRGRGPAPRGVAWRGG